MPNAVTKAVTQTVAQTVIGAGLVPVALLCALGSPVLAGPADAGGGVTLTFGLGLRLAADSNPRLTPGGAGGGGAGSSTTTALVLSFGLTTETAQSTLALDLSGSLARYAGSGNAARDGLNTPKLTLAYTHTAGTGAFTLTGDLIKVNLAQPNAITDFETGAGTRQTGTLSTGIDFGKTGPFGAGAIAGLTTATYDNASGFFDSRTLKLGVTAHADLSAVLHAQVGLHTSRFTQSGLAARNTPGLDASLTLDRPTGSYVASLTSDHAPEGQRSTFDLGQQLDLARGGALSYSLGATRATTGSTFAIGALTYQQPLPAGALTLDLNRAVQANPYTDVETVLSSANLGLTRDVTPSGSLALALNWAQQRNTAFGFTTTNTSLSATWTQALTPDWALDLGYTRRLRAQDLVGQSHSDSLALTLHRAFSVRY